MGKPLVCFFWKKHCMKFCFSLANIKKVFPNTFHKFIVVAALLDLIWALISLFLIVFMSNLDWKGQISFLQFILRLQRVLSNFQRKSLGSHWKNGFGDEVKEKVKNKGPPTPREPKEKARKRAWQPPWGMAVLQAKGHAWTNMHY